MTSMGTVAGTAWMPQGPTARPHGRADSTLWTCAHDHTVDTRSRSQSVRRKSLSKAVFLKLPATNYAGVAYNDPYSDPKPGEAGKKAVTREFCPGHQLAKLTAHRFATSDPSRSVPYAPHSASHLACMCCAAHLWVPAVACCNSVCCCVACAPRAVAAQC